MELYCEFEELNNNINKIKYIYDKFDNFEINNNIKYFDKKNFIKKYNVFIKIDNKHFSKEILSENLCVDKDLFSKENKYECPVCYENILSLNSIQLNCKHNLCKYCYEKWNEKCCENNNKMSCPLCRKNIDYENI